MLVIQIKGGLGNQMFQYAFGQVAKSKVVYDTSWFNTQTLRLYGLDFFNMNPKLISYDKLNNLRRGYSSFFHLRIKKHNLLFENPCNIFNPKLLDAKDVILNGYFQCHQYYNSIRKQLLKEIVPLREINAVNQKYLDLIKKTNSISIHIRRTDYILLKDSFGFCGIEYYKKAIQHIISKVKNPHFFLFSDDIMWVKENFKLDFPYEIIDVNLGQDTPWDLWLMKHCKHNIIANSSFSWWGAWLNENPEKIVCAPQKWFADNRPIDIVPPNWIRF
ncbi:MAG: alpha-1,2-fucosyltransferase [Alphaproteobacteria bacterium]|nr:alpha-1,2-fucosyltransferase [Alphaproteobacteria bacterium]